MPDIADHMFSLNHDDIYHWFMCFGPVVIRALQPAPEPAEGKMVWQVKDYADGWIHFGQQQEAENYAKCYGGILRKIFIYDASPHPAKAGDKVCAEEDGDDYKKPGDAYKHNHETMAASPAAMDEGDGS